MPKMKTRKSILKRIAITGTGKLLRRTAFANHLKMAKSKKQIRKYRNSSVITGKDARKLRLLLPG